MLKAGKFAFSAAVLLFGGNTAIAQRGFQPYEVFYYTFYDDAAHTNVVGHGATRCDGQFDHSGTYYITSGENSAYYDEYSSGAYCTEGGLVVGQ